MKKSMQSALAFVLTILFGVTLLVPGFAASGTENVLAAASTGNNVVGYTYNSGYTPNTGTGAYATCVSPALSGSQMPVFSTWDNGAIAISVVSYAIVTQWDTSGCPLHGQFDGQCTMRALRSTFADAYNLRANYDTARAADTSGNVLPAYYPSYGTLRDLLSASTVRQCQSMLGSYNILKYLQTTSDYQYNTGVRFIVDQQLQVFDGQYSANLRRSLAFFFPEALLNDMNFTQLMGLSETVLGTRAYATFSNTLHGHDCSTVRSLLSRGYSLSYVTQLYTNSAESAVKEIWPDYNARMTAYWQSHGSW